MDEHSPSMSADETIEMVETVLRKAKYAQVRRLSPEIVRVEAFNDKRWNEMLIRFEAGIFGHELDHIQEHYPTTWVDALKARWSHWLPMWFTMRWPIKYTTVTLTASQVFPKMVLPDHESTVFLTKDSRPWR